eukprot:scaffold25077_cov48-Cyclotella_meneghiniana.AAC.8
MSVIADVHVGGPNDSWPLEGRFQTWPGNPERHQWIQRNQSISLIPLYIVQDETGHPGMGLKEQNVMIRPHEDYICRDANVLPKSSMADDLFKLSALMKAVQMFLSW